ncbi:hypothetical protein ACMBCN_02140 [Candidatus Liberibacter asiaticus]|nr:hypothetical protein [Candidatus Liberibacter asiaticus]
MDYSTELLQLTFSMRDNITVFKYNTSHNPKTQYTQFFFFSLFLFSLLLSLFFFLSSSLTLQRNAESFYRVSEIF